MHEMTVAGESLGSAKRNLANLQSKEIQNKCNWIGVTIFAIFLI